jgi:hypothetical protein
VLALERGAARAPLALLRGSAVNSAGRSSGLTAPSGPAQRALAVAGAASPPRSRSRLRVARPASG